MKKQRFEINPSTKEIRGTFVISKKTFVFIFLALSYLLKSYCGKFKFEVGITHKYVGEKTKDIRHKYIFMSQRKYIIAKHFLILIIISLTSF